MLSSVDKGIQKKALLLGSTGIVQAISWYYAMMRQEGGLCMAAPFVATEIRVEKRLFCRIACLVVAEGMFVVFITIVGIGCRRVLPVVLLWAG